MRATIFAVVLACQTPVLSDVTPRIPSDSDQMQGAWLLEDLTIDGENERNTAGKVGFVAGLRQSAEWVFKGDTLLVRTGATTREFKFKLYPGKSPKEFDAEYVGTDEGYKDYFRGGLRGIYSLDGDRLMRCYAEPGQPRPTEFKSDQGSLRTLMILKRKPVDKK